MGKEQIYLAKATWVIPILWFIFSYTGFHLTESSIQLLLNFSSTLMLLLNLPLFFFTLKMLTFEKERRQLDRQLITITMINFVLIMILCIG